jgi:hypothetical protein
MPRRRFSHIVPRYEEMDIAASLIATVAVTVWFDSRQTTMSIRQSDGTFDGDNIVLWATPLDPDRPGRKTVARAHLEEGGRVVVHQHFLIDDKGNERMMIEMRMTRK